MDTFTSYTKPNGFVTASLVCGISAIVSTVFMTVYLPFILGGMAIIFAVLSKTDPQIPMVSKAKTGLICGLIGLVGNLALIAICITLVFTNPTYRGKLNDACEQMYGITFDEMLEQIQESAE